MKAIDDLVKSFPELIPQFNFIKSAVNFDRTLYIKKEQLMKIVFLDSTAIPKHISFLAQVLNILGLNMIIRLLPKPLSERRMRTLLLPAK